ncbi:hypothetical protein GYMLUDRAFT_463331 [Collybiopsis luxurians FD-317 M1]|uniref:Uncharacterized protein n=1 Tax=Collybiopsis luxurians FD-317 M1 TaxID=944289 RepID=A0A0D0D245_9AGAR|nr:hypothetical protein GYMLUDRAFT_463331 [Collybiopsis luxurians FD-317 M1]
MEGLASTLKLSYENNLFLQFIILCRHNHYTMKESAFCRRTRTQNMLLLFVESGAIYCSIQVLYIVLVLLHIYGPANSILSLTLAIFSVIFAFASAFYPITVIILVNMDNTSVIESFHNNEGSHRESYSSGITAQLNFERS